MSLSMGACGIQIRQKAARRATPGWLASAALAALSLLAPATASANTNLFYDSRTCTLSWAYCQALSYYGVLAGTTDDTITVNGNWTFNSGIAVGTTSNLSKSGTNTANDLVDFADTVNFNSGSCAGAPNYCGAGTWNGTAPTAANATRVNNAQSALDNILSILAGPSFNTGNGTQTSLLTSGTLNIEAGITPGGIKVYRNTSTYTQTGALTFGCGGATCNPGDLVVLKFTGGTSTFNFNINLADGLTADQLLFYIPSNNLAFSPTAAGTTVRGSFFVGAGTITLGCTGGACDPVALRGRVYNDNGAITFNSRGGGSTDDLGVATPEPGTWMTMAGGLAAAIALARRRRAKNPPPRLLG